MTKYLPFTIILTFLACSPEPRPIAFGVEQCHYCKMGIVDRLHAAQAVTAKGKIYSFDAIECMVHFLQENQNEKDMAHLVVADYGTQGKWLVAPEAQYLICKEIPSPMGAYLSAFNNENTALQTCKDGQLLNWHEMKNKTQK